MKKKLVISAQNIFEGGPLIILKKLIEQLQYYDEKYDITIFIYNRKILKLNNISKKIKFIEIKKSRKSYFHRIYYEFFFLKKFSHKHKPDIWISMQDFLPNISAKKKIVYFHTPIIFYKMNLKDIYFEPKTFLRSIYYRYIYKLEIYKKTLMIVQQNWIKKNFEAKFKFKKIRVVKPINKKNSIKKSTKKDFIKKHIFFYPSLPRFQKNFETIVKACEILQGENKNFMVYFTISKNENRYSQYIFNLAKNIKQIKFIGRQDHSKINKIYKKTNTLIFPSKLETWGLPLSEAIDYKIPIIAADLKYARETLKEYKLKSFFKFDDYFFLKKLMEQRLKSVCYNKSQISSLKNNKNNIMINFCKDILS